MTPPSQTAFRDLMALQREGKIAHIGVSNFGVAQLQEALETGATIAVNQVCYNLIFRACEFEVLPFCREHNIEQTSGSSRRRGLGMEGPVVGPEFPDGGRGSGNLVILEQAAGCHIIKKTCSQR